ncbi:protein roadkill-like [Planococcus citri]|uniref:protein roadkill-like n=1 Tax=Planococcus citri TaxID=170843 RepID=UPI0031F97EA0
MNLLRINEMMLLLLFNCILIQHQSTKADTNTIQWNTDSKALNKITYNWTIPNFMDLQYDRLQICTEIPTKKTQTSKWRVYLHLQGIEYKDHNYMGLRLQLVNFDGVHKKTIVKFKASVFDRDDRHKEYSKEEVKELNADINEICWEEFCNDDRKFIQYKLLEDGALTIYIQISYYYIECSKHTSSLGLDMDSLLKNPKHADVELTLQSNGKKYYVHRAILAARSGHFARLFEDFDKKHEQVTLNITNTDEEIMDEILRYIYTEKCEISNKIAERLFVAADEYELEGLETLCSQFMCDGLSVGNAARMLVLADKYRVDEFKSNVISFIVENSFQVLQTIDWKNLVEPNSLLLKEMCEIFTPRLSIKNDRP